MDEVGYSVGEHDVSGGQLSGQIIGHTGGQPCVSRRYLVDEVGIPLEKVRSMIVRQPSVLYLRTHLRIAPTLRFSSLSLFLSLSLCLLPSHPPSHRSYSLTSRHLTWSLGSRHMVPGLTR